jgi:hypothetical protein
VDARQLPIEHDNIVPVGLDHLEGRFAVRAGVDRHPGRAQPPGDHVAQRLIIFDHQYPHQALSEASRQLASLSLQQCLVFICLRRTKTIHRNQ